MANSCTHSSGVQKKSNIIGLSLITSVYTLVSLFCAGMVIIVLVEVAAIVTFVIVFTVVAGVAGILCSCDYNCSRFKIVI